MGLSPVAGFCGPGANLHLKSFLKVGSTLASDKSAQKNNKSKQTGLAAFSEHFSEVYSDRWQGLLDSLKAQEVQTARRNKFATIPSISLQPFDGLDNCYQWSRGELGRDPQGLLDFYIMDPASVICARALNVQPGDKVLDMCAAPGGKSLILAESLMDSGELLANEISAGRRERLKKVIQQYISRVVRDRVWVTGKEAGLFAKSHPEYFDRILVDAPCSGERHLLQSPKDLEEWSVTRSQKLAQRQYALLTAALIAVKSGGQIVYSTCSISPIENDDVIERLLAKKSGQFEVVKVVSSGEATQFGNQFLPDRVGYGPIYFSVLQKK